MAAVLPEPAGDDAQRAERLLDAAAELLVRWGYRRVTVEDVARHAGVGKGTVYLHVRTKDALFLTVLLRAQRRLLADVVDRALVEPEYALPWHMTRMLFEKLQADDIARALYLGDGEVFGRLARESASTLGELAAHRDAIVREHFRLLREAGLVHDELTPDDQLHVWGATTGGFFLAAGATRGHWSFGPGPAREGELLADTLRRTLAGPAPESSAGAIAERVAGLYRPLVDHIDTEWRHRTR